MFFWVSATEITANIAVVIGLFFIALEFWKYRQSQKRPISALDVSSYKDSNPRNFKLWSDYCYYTEAVLEENGTPKDITILFKWLIFNNNNFHGKIVLQDLDLPKFFYGNYPQTKMPIKPEIEKQIIKLPVKIEAGDSIYGYFPFVSVGHQCDVQGKKEIMVTLTRGKPEYKEINIQPTIYHIKDFEKESDFS